MATSFAAATQLQSEPASVVTQTHLKAVDLSDLVDATIFGDGLATITPTMVTVVSSAGTEEARLIGTGLTWNALSGGDFEVTGGTITRVEFLTGTAGNRSLAVTFNGFSIDAVALDDAVDAVWDTGNSEPFNALFDAYRYDITGSSGDEFLGDNPGKDTLDGGGGNDTLEGGPGTDTAKFTGNLSQYTITVQSDGSVTVQDNTADRDGTDTLISVERLQFADQTVDAPGELASIFFAVNPAGTWLADPLAADPTDPAPGPTQVSLSQVQATAGDWITLSRRGDFQYGPADQGFTDTVSNMLALFVDAQGAPVAPVTFLSSRSSTQTSGRNTDIAQDFVVAAGITRVMVPEGAVALRFSAYDRFYSDNLDPDNDFGVEIRKSADNDDVNGADVLFGTTQNDSLQGGAGFDTLAGGVGDDTLRGEDGDDQLYGDAGADLLDGGAGFDMALYTSSPSAVSVNLAQGTASDGYGSADTLNSIELVWGSAYNDRLVGGHPANGSGATDGFEGFLGNQGNDTIDGGAGFDRAYYDNSPYAVSVALGGSSPGTARDGWLIDGVPNTDGIDTLINIEEVRGSSHDDTLTGSDEPGRYESFEGRAGNDTVDGRGGTDRANYQTSPAGVNVNLAMGRASDGWGGTDTLRNIEVIRGSEYGDTLRGDTGANLIDGRAGNDVLYGGDGSDTLIGGAGNDTLDGGLGEDLAIIDGLRGDYAVSYVESTGVLTLDSGSVNGLDTLVGVEWFQFGADAARLSLAQLMDARAPQLGAVNPLAGARKVATDAPLVFSFDEAVRLGAGPIQLKKGDGTVVRSFSAGDAVVEGQTLRLDAGGSLGVYTDYIVEFGAGAVQDLAGNDSAAGSSVAFRTATLDELYHFFVVAFAAAPGATYMGQLAEAYNYFSTQPSQPGVTAVQQIVEIFTGKPQFTDPYPLELTHRELATRLVDNIVKGTAGSDARQGAISDIETVLDLGWSRGKMLYTVFGNLAGQSLDDAQWGATARQFQNQLTVARYFTEEMGMATVDLATLRGVIGSVTPDTDVSTVDKIVQIIGTIPPGG
jgi:Ca2+-binding RTX toxin-like protein